MTSEKPRNSSRWQPGQSGNPAGRPKGARNKLGEKFIADMYADWQQHGVEVIERVRAENPVAYLKVVAATIPNELNINVDLRDQLASFLDGMSDTASESDDENPRLVTH